jgi:uncharacterized DUF497 family protein
MQVEFVWDDKKNASNQLRTLVIVFTERSGIVSEQLINRIISARKATKKEFQYYWNARKGDCL